MPSGKAHYNGAKTHCKNGHALVGGNLRIDPKSGARACRVCARRTQREYRRRKRAVS